MGTAFAAGTTDGPSNVDESPGLKLVGLEACGDWWVLRWILSRGLPRPTGHPTGSRVSSSTFEFGAGALSAC